MPHSDGDMMMSGKTDERFGVVVWVYCATLVVIVASSFVPDLRLWGFNWYAYFPWYWLALLAVVGVGALIIALQMKGSVAAEDTGTRSFKTFWLTASLLTAFFVMAFFLFSARTHFLGDGYQLLASLQSGVNHKPWEMGTFMVQKWVYSLSGGGGEKSAELALQLVSCIAGALFALVSAFVASRLFASYIRRLLYLLGATTGGYALLFFGYFESYPLFVLSVGCLFQVGLLVVRDKLSRWYILPFLAVAAFFHIFVVALLPAVIYLLLRDTVVGKRVSSASVRTKTIAVTALILFAVATFAHFYYHSLFFRFTIVPLLTDRNTVEGYTLFSGKHLLDYLNHLFQLFPGMAVASVALWPVLRSQAIRRSDVIYVLLSLLPSMGLVFIFNPGLGFPRDWDLFCFVGVPLVCGAFYLLLDEARPSSSGVSGAVLSVALGLLILAPRVASQYIPETSIAVFDRYAQLDRVKNSTGRYLVRQYLESRGEAEEAERRRVLDNATLPEGEWIDQAGRLIAEGKVDEGIVLLRKATVSDPTHYAAWGNLGIAYGILEMNDSAALFLEIADARMPYNAEVKRNLGSIYFAEGKYESAERLFRESAAIAPDNPKTIVRMLLLYEKLGREADLLALLDASQAKQLSSVLLLMESAELGMKSGEDAVGAALLRRALKMGADTNTICELQRRYPRIHLINCP